MSFSFIERCISGIQEEEILTSSLKSKSLTNEQINSNCELCDSSIETVHYTAACWYLSGSVYFPLTLQHKLANIIYQKIRAKK